MSWVATAIIASAVIGAGSSAIIANQNKPNIPKNPGDADLQGNQDMATNAKDRQNRARQQALAAYGRSDTVLTGPSGLGGNGQGTPNNFQQMGKTLLGQ
jgi:hypothetical protein